MVKRVASAAVALVAVVTLSAGAGAQQGAGAAAAEQGLLNRLTTAPDDLSAHLDLVKLYAASNRLVEAEQLLSRALALVREQRLGSFSKTVPAIERMRPSESMNQAPLRVGGSIMEPRQTKRIAPIYPPEAQAAGVQGVVILEAVIGVDGTVTDARVLRSIPMLEQAAVDAVRQWTYTPTLLNGAPIPVIMTITVNFSLR
jgi:TonB family protein